MAHSYLLGGATAGLHVRIAAPPAYRPDPAVLAAAARLAAQTGGSVQVTADAKAACADADALATDVWTSMGQEGQEAGPGRRAPARTSWTRTSWRWPGPAASCCTACPRTAARRSPPRSSTARSSAVWDQAENRLHAQKALLTWLLASAPLGGAR